MFPYVAAVAFFGFISSSNCWKSSDDFGDEVVLLQAAAELKKKPPDVEPTVPTAEAEYKFSCPSTASKSCGSLCEGISEMALPDKPDPVPAVREEPQLPAEAVVEDASKPDHTKSSEESSKNLMCLCLLVFIAAVGLQRLTQTTPASKATCSAETPASREAWAGLLRAAAAGDSSVFEDALEQCSNLNKVDTWGCTALHYAAKGGSVDIARRLMEFGLQVNATEVLDEIPLHIAARAGHKDVCELLLDAGSAINALNAQDWTPLVVAGDAKKPDVCSLLLDRGGGVGGLADNKLPSMVSLMIAQQALLKAVGVESQ